MVEDACWESVKVHLNAKLRQGCAQHTALHSALYRDRAPGYGCPACMAVFATFKAAVQHLSHMDDSCHRQFKYRDDGRRNEQSAQPHRSAAPEPQPSIRHVPMRHTLPQRQVDGFLNLEQVPTVVPRGNNARPARVSTELYSAAKSGRVHEVRALLERGADPNQRSDDGFTPLMTSAEAGHARVVAVLAAHPRCDLNLRNAYGQNALAFAAQNGHVDAALEMINAPRQHDPLKIDALSGELPPT